VKLLRLKGKIIISKFRENHNNKKGGGGKRKIALASGKKGILLLIKKDFTRQKVNFRRKED